MNTYDFLLGVMFSKAEAQAYDQLHDKPLNYSDTSKGRVWLYLNCGERITIAICRGWSAMGGNNVASFGYPKNDKYPDADGVHEERGHYDILFNDDDLTVKNTVFQMTGKDQYENRMDLKDVATLIDRCGGINIQATFEYLHSRINIYQ